jgi:hypothetical protein
MVLLLPMLMEICVTLLEISDMLVTSTIFVTKENPSKISTINYQSMNIKCQNTFTMKNLVIHLDNASSILTGSVDLLARNAGLIKYIR